MSFTGVGSLDRRIGKSNAWLAGIEEGFGTHDRRLAYRVGRAWLHSLRDRLTVEVAAHFAAQLPELLRGVFYDGWNPSRVPLKYAAASTWPGPPAKRGFTSPTCRRLRPWSPRPSGSTYRPAPLTRRSPCCPVTCVSCWSRR